MTDTLFFSRSSSKMACFVLLLISALLHVGTSQIFLGCFMEELNLPEGCKCVNPHQPMISCQSLGLTNVPNVTKAHSLDLGNNSISRLPANAFAHISGLKKLYLKKNKIQYIDPNAFTNLDLEVLDLCDNAFRGVPSVLGNNEQGIANVHRLKSSESFVRAYMVNLENNDISYLQASAFTYVTGLRKLYLAKNKIKFVHEFAFVGLDLETLDLSDNILITIPPIFGDTQSGLTNLTGLGLSKNFVSTLNNDAFKGLPELEHLYLSGNPINQIQPDAWLGPSSLKVLEFGADSLDILKIPTGNLKTVTSLAITGAKVQRLDFMKPWFESFPQVRHLKLNNVGLRDTHFTKGNFPSVWKTQLQSLSLRRNELTQVPFNALNFTSLEDVDLSENMIKKFAGSGLMLPHPSSILKFNISNNVFSYIYSSKILSLRNAHEIDLRNNYFRDIWLTTSMIDRDLRPDVVLYLGGNPWYCSCDNPWMKDLVNHQVHKHLTDYEINNTYRCGHKNGEHTGKLIKDVPDYNFDCSLRRPS